MAGLICASCKGRVNEADHVEYTEVHESQTTTHYFNSIACLISFLQGNH